MRFTERRSRKSQIIMFPGGFSAGDEPEGSAKFFATAFRNEVVKEEIYEAVKREGRPDAQASATASRLSSSWGLCRSGTIVEQNAGSPTLTYNTIGRHISKMV